MTNEHTINALTSIFMHHSGLPPDQISPENRQYLKNRLRLHIEKTGALHMALPAFPFKSINTARKVLGPNPDFGEAIALDTLSSLCEKINQSVPTKLYLVSDGHVFSDLLDIPDEAVDHYFDQTQKLTASPYFSFKKIKDLLWRRHTVRTS